MQYYHTLEGIPLGWSLDLLVPSDSGLAPETASQVYAGLFFTGKKHRLTVGAYLKKMDHLIFFKDATQLFSTAVAGWRDEIKTGSGNSKGSIVLQCMGAVLDSLYYADKPDSLHLEVIPAMGSSKYGQSSQLNIRKWKKRDKGDSWCLSEPTPGKLDYCE